MSEVKTIKDIDDETWSRFKNLAAKNKVTLGTLFRDLVLEHSKKSKEFWSTILSSPKILHEEEAKDIGIITQRVRKEYGFRQ